MLIYSCYVILCTQSELIFVDLLCLLVPGMNHTQSPRIVRGRGRNKRKWTAEEDEELVKALCQVSADPRYKVEGGGFKNCYSQGIQSILAQKLPGHGIKASPHVDSRLKVMKQKYYSIKDMLASPGFSWDDTRKMIQCEKQRYDEYCRVRYSEYFGTCIFFIVISFCFDLFIFCRIILEPRVCMASHLYILIHLMQYIARTDTTEKGWKGLKKQLLTWRMMKIQMKLEMTRTRTGCPQEYLVAPWLH